MKRKMCLVMSTLLILVFVITACAPAATESQESTDADAAAGDSFDWKRFEGEEITLLFNEHGWTNGIRPYISDFEDLTGIKVDLQAFAEDVYYDKMELALRSEKGVADVYMLPMDSNAYSQWDAGLIAPLDDYLNDPTMTMPDYDLADFTPGFIQLGYYPSGEEDAKLYGIPTVFETYILFYNKELVDKYLDGKVPETMDELLADAQKITAEGNGEEYGIVVRGVRSDTIMDTVTGVILNGWGDEPAPLPYCVWFDGDWSKPRFNDPRIVEGLTYWVEFMKAGPPNIQAIDWYDGNQLFLQGKLAFYLDASMFSAVIENPEKSTVAGKTGYSPLLKTPSGSGPATAHWGYGLGIPANSENKDAAWYFVQWATSKEMEPKISVETAGAARMSTWENEDYLASETIVPEFAETLQTVLKTTYPSAVMYPGWKEYAMMVVDAIQEMYGGPDPQTVMDAVQERVEQDFK